MSYEIFVGLAALVGGLLVPILYFRNSGTALEQRLNDIIKEKRQIIRSNYLQFLEKVFERFKTTRSLSDELQDELEGIADISSRLYELPYALAKVVREITTSFIYLFGLAFFIFVYAYLPTLGLESDISFWSQSIIFALVALSTTRFVQLGLLKIFKLRKFEELINDIDRAKTIDEFYIQELHELTR